MSFFPKQLDEKVASCKFLIQYRAHCLYQIMRVSWLLPLSSCVIMFVMLLVVAVCVAGVGFITSSLTSYIERSRPLNTHGVPCSCTTKRRK